MMECGKSLIWVYHLSLQFPAIKKTICKDYNSVTASLNPGKHSVFRFYCIWNPTRSRGSVEKKLLGNGMSSLL